MGAEGAKEPPLGTLILVHLRGDKNKPVQRTRTAVPVCIDLKGKNVEFPAWYEGEVMERVEGQTIEVSECCGASVEPCVSCGDDTPVHTECVECRSLIERVGEDHLLSRDLLLHSSHSPRDPVRVSYDTVAVGRPCGLCGGGGKHAGVVGRYPCTKCEGTGRLK